MFQRLLKALVIIGGAGFSMPIHGLETSLQSPETSENTCLQQTRAQERSRGIPRHLLTAISQVESGRWDKSRKANIAWPWTVTSGGTGQFFETREEAIAEVEFLMTEGIRNIDVGCMQINLHYHADAFETLSDAFNPALNTAYAAEFLVKLKTSSNNWPNTWINAAGTYQSSTPARKAYYQGKVIAFWNEARRFPATVTATAAPRPAINPASNLPVEIDHARMNKLNAAFKNRRISDPVARNKAGRAKDFQIRNQQEMQAWQKAQQSGRDITVLLALRRAQQKQRRQKEITSIDTLKFPEKRKSQLQKWRETGIWHGG